MAYLVSFVDVQILYLIHKTGVEDLCTAQDFLRGDIIVGDDSFLYIAWDFLRGDNFVGGDKLLGVDDLSGNLLLPRCRVFG